MLNIVEILWWKRLPTSRAKICETTQEEGKTKLQSHFIVRFVIDIEYYQDQYLAMLCALTTDTCDIVPQRENICDWIKILMFGEDKKVFLESTARNACGGFSTLHFGVAANFSFGVNCLLLWEHRNWRSALLPMVPFDGDLTQFATFHVFLPTRKAASLKFAFA